MYTILDVFFHTPISRTPSRRKSTLVVERRVENKEITVDEFLRRRRERMGKLRFTDRK